MNNNLYWTVFKNLEHELIELSNLIHIDDNQLEVYSIKITELIIRTVVEVESISKELYLQNEGTKDNDRNLFFDTDCLDLLESKWLLSKKQVHITGLNFYFNSTDNKILTPLNKANKRGSSSSDWLKAYQALKHNRSKSLNKGNLRNLIKALASLYILNLYYKDTIYDFGKDETDTNFDNSLGSAIFAVKIHRNNTVSVDKEYSKNNDFDECIYLFKSTKETISKAQENLKIFIEKTNNRATSLLIQQIEKGMIGIQNKNQEEINAIFEKIKNDNMSVVANENKLLLKKIFEDLKFEAILNKQQY